MLIFAILELENKSQGGSLGYSKGYFSTSTTSIAFADIALVPFGEIEVEGLLLQNGSFAIAIAQANRLLGFSASPQNANRSVQRILGATFSPHRAKTPLNSNAVVIMSLLEFERLLAKLDRAGNIKAQEIRDQLIGLSLHQLFCDAFKIKFEAEERQAWLKDRQIGKITHRTHTDAIKSYLIRHPEKSDSYRIHIYANVADRVNTLVFGMTAKQLRQARNTTVALLRDTHSAADLLLIERIEDYAMRLIDKTDTEPMSAVAEAYEFYS